MSDYKPLIKDIFLRNGMDGLLTAPILQKLSDLINRTVSVNENVNLTAITNGEDVALKHIADSATIITHIPQNARLLDVGTGGGFPALPVAILRPDVSVYALDSTLKKLKTIDETVALLDIPNLKTVNGRAEELGKSVNYRERFDVVTARAVSALNILTELCIPFVKVGGTFISMKGSSAAEEITLARSGIIQLGGSSFKDEEFSLSYGETQLRRHIVISKKVKPTPPQFPRIYSRITKKPL